MIMDNSMEQFVVLLSTAIRGQRLETYCYTDNIDYSKIFRFAAYHKVDSLIYSILKTNDILDNELLSAWKRNAIVSNLYQKRGAERCREILIKFNENGIPTILLKGAVLRNLYPQPELRWMSDIDILVNKENISKARRILEDMGYFCKDDHDPKEIHYYHKNEISVELHWRVTVPGYIENDDLFEDSVWNNAVPISFQGVPALSLSTDDILLHMCIHMAFHIRNGGFGLRMLCDLVLFIEKVGQYVNWSVFKERIKLYNIEKFTYAVLTICSKLFGLRIPELLVVNIDENDIYIDDLIDDIIETGHFANKSPERKNIRMLARISRDEDIYITNKFRLFIRIAFPSRNGLAKNYPYLHDYPLLYPVAWIQRFYKNVIRKLDLQRIFMRFKFSKDTFNKYKKRVNLLKWLGFRH